MNHKIEVFTDGASRNNPGHAGIGVVIKENKETIKELHEYIGKNTNNFAEYCGLVKGLESTLKLGHKKAIFYLDSELLVKQIKGEYQVKNPELKPLYLKAKKLIDQFTIFEIKHIPRHLNREADKLANIAINQAIS